MSRARPRPGRRQRRLGQNFLADPNLLALIVREARLDPGDVVLEVGGGGGVLTERLAEAVARVHVIEIDERLRSPLEEVTAEHRNVELVWGDAMRIDLAALEPAPVKMVANLPYAIAAPLLLRTIEELPSLRAWLVMLQREVAERLRAAPGTRLYGAPSVVVQLACDVKLVRTVDPAVFRPRPRVQSALLRLARRGPAPEAALRALIRDAFAHRRKSLARSLELASPGRLDSARAALERIGKRADARAETLAPEDFARLAAELESSGSRR